MLQPISSASSPNHHKLNPWQFSHTDGMSAAYSIPTDINDPFALRLPGSVLMARTKFAPNCSPGDPLWAELHHQQVPHVSTKGCSDRTARISLQAVSEV